MVDVVDQWTGTGIRLPFLPAPDDHGLSWLDGMDLIRQSVTTILDTEPGERIMLPAFGCGLRRYLMAPNNLTTRTAMASDIRSALEAWEPRIQLLEVTVAEGEDPSLVWVDIAYVRRADLRPDNLVYPFYLR
ncbi:GPW/gp25 family protein [Microbacterium sp. B2969]|uniref:GPW/gp25 family protein n=1 Tax=Microbacterium alkaliflavum TaxID=3248839 RepID=A0ABW7QA65_9MICO